MGGRLTPVSAQGQYHLKAAELEHQKKGKKGSAMTLHDDIQVVERGTTVGSLTLTTNMDVSYQYS